MRRLTSILVPRAALALSVLLAGCALPGKQQRAVESTPEEAQAASDAGNWTLAVERWYGIFSADPGQRVEAGAMTARAMLQLNDLEGACRVLDLGLSSHPAEPLLLNLKGQALALLGFARAAEDCFLRSLEVDATQTDVLLQLATVRMQLGLESAAAKALQRAIELGHGDAETWIALGRARKRYGDHEGAVAAFTRGLELGPGKNEDLIEAAQECAGPEVKKNRSESLTHGLEWLGRVVERDPKHVCAHFELGVLCEELGRNQEAVEHYLRALEIDAGYLVALRNLAVLYSNLGDEEGTRRMVERALVIEGNPTRRKALEKLLEKPEEEVPAESVPGKRSG